MGIILQEQKKYTEALEFYQKAWAIRQKNLSLDSSLLAQSHLCLGNVHYFLRHLDLALEHFQWALNIWKKALIPRPLEMASIIRNLAFVYYRKGDLQQTISLMKQSAIIYRHCASSTHPELMQIEESLRRLTRQTVDT